MICPRCQLVGEHLTADACVAAARAAMRAKIGLPPPQPAWTPARIRVPRKKVKPQDYNPDLLTITQAATITQMSIGTIRNWIKAGKIERVYTAGGSSRIVAASLWRLTK